MNARWNLAQRICATAILAIACSTSTCQAHEILGTIKRDVQFIVIDPHVEGFDEKVVTELRKLSEVQAVAPFYYRFTILRVGDTKHRLLALGIDPACDHEVRDYQIASGELTDKNGGVLPSDKFGASAGIKLDQEVSFITRLGAVKTNVRGFYKPELPVARDTDGTMLLPIQAIQKLFNVDGKVLEALITLKPGADRNAARVAIEMILPDGVKFLESIKPRDSGEARTERTAPSAAIKK